MRIEDAPRTKLGFLEARPGDVIDKDGLLLVDVRREEELLEDLGHIHGVRHVPMEEILASGLPSVDRATPVVVVCQNGFQSRKCAEALVQEYGYTEVYHLVGGMIRWNAEARPVARVRTWR
ncbi:MAG: rhodanese-like domain-containing protein [Myxococcota bacterium]